MLLGVTVNPSSKTSTEGWLLTTTIIIVLILGALI
jgi:hypothetical protein